MDKRVRVQNKVSDILVGPFDEYNQRWYLVIGAPITLVMILLSFFPHMGVMMSAIKLNLKRWFDRGCTSNKRRTKQIAQDEYEDLYTGPEFILQLRYAQILSQIFITMTFSSGIPILYLITLIRFIISYWVDKFLMLRYFRK